MEEGSDDEIPELIPLKNSFEIEKDVVYSKNGVIGYVNNLLGEVNVGSSEWETVIETTGVQGYIKKSSGGSNTCMFMKMQFNKKFDLMKLVRALTIVTNRKNWDKEL